MNDNFDVADICVDMRTGHIRKNSEYQNGQTKVFTQEEIIVKKRE